MNLATIVTFPPEKIKVLLFPPINPRPIDEAISTAGGVRFDALTDDGC
jgi:predicted flavoprotein YhiN